VPTVPSGSTRPTRRSTATSSPAASRRWSRRRSRIWCCSATSRPRTSRTQVGQLLAEYLGWPQATFAGAITSEDDKALVVGREVEGGTARVRVTLPAVVTVIDKIVKSKSVTSKHTPATHAYPEGVRFAALMAIMAAKKKPLAELKLAELAPDATLKVRYGAAEMPPKRAAGVKVKDVKELVTKLKTEAKVI
jgi:electron transfer flavoprotein beta subunit